MSDSDLPDDDDVDIDDEFQPVDELELASEGAQLDDPEQLELD